jgi:hypothetical protein
MNDPHCRKGFQDSGDFGTDLAADIKAYLDEISDRLWSRHAAVMVGAGFSRNARPVNPKAVSFPTWPELADSFLEKLHNRETRKDAVRFMSPLRLADEVQAAFGRPALDQLLRTRIPDKEYEPSDLHVRLLEFPWVDVFTVNYDTLLERACTKVTSQRFDVVVNKEDLVYSTRPRIVKLHGSFPSTRPLTISEEDYRKYPHEQAPFVNTVQQALLENTLCLLGFSGDDPNFLHWIGWVRDNLGKANSPKIYLIGVLHLTVGQRELLEQRNVVPLDLGGCPSVTNDHSAAISLFLSHLQSKKPTAACDWPRGKTFADQATIRNIDAHLGTWRSQREAYPNWVVAPKDARESLFLNLQSVHAGLPALNESVAVPPPADILFLRELNWRLERVLQPIFIQLLPHYERILARYNPFPKQNIPSTADVTPDRTDLTTLEWREISECWCDLTLATLRFYREEALGQKWTETDNRLRAVCEHFSAEQLARWHYERCHQALFSLDLSELRTRLGAWHVNPSLAFWEAKRAGLLGELGDFAEAEAILESSLATIRGNQQLAPVVTDFTWVSQESLVMYMLQSVKFARRFTEQRQIGPDPPRDQFRARWNDLTLYKCDPWNELAFFKVQLNLPSRLEEPVTHKQEFDVGRETVTRHTSQGDEGSRLGYAFLRYCEDVGMPFALANVNLAHETAQHAAEKIAPNNPDWAVVTLMRIGKPNLADSFFGRAYLARMTVDTADETAGRFIKIFNAAQQHVDGDTILTDKHLGVRIVRLVPEVLSRFCTKCSLARRDDIFSLLQVLYANPTIGLSEGTAHLADRLLGSYTKHEQLDRVPLLLEFPTSFNTQNVLVPHYFPEPFEFLSVGVLDVRAHQTAAIPREAIATLISKMVSGDSHERLRVGRRLGVLHELGLLDDEQKRAFGAGIWARVGQNGFPADMPFYVWAYLVYPTPPEIAFLAMFKTYVFHWSHTSIDSNAGAVTVNQTGRASVQITQGNIGWCQNVLGATKRIKGSGPIDWTENEAIILFGKLVDWWNAGNERLREPDEFPFMESIPDEFRARYRKLVEVLALVVAPRLSVQTNPDVLSRVSSLLLELEEYGIPALLARVACVHLFPNSVDGVFQVIVEQLCGSDRDRVLNATVALRQLVLVEHHHGDARFGTLLRLLGQQVKWRREVALVFAMQVGKAVVAETPDLLSEDMLRDILEGLRHLLNESKPGLNVTDERIAGRLVFRENAASLAFALYNYYSARRLQVPPVIVEWQKVCGDPEEFAEIRNQWQD